MKLKVEIDLDSLNLDEWGDSMGTHIKEEIKRQVLGKVMREVRSSVDEVLNKDRVKLREVSKKLAQKTLEAMTKEEKHV